VGFYLMCAFCQSVLATQEQKPGLRMSMGLGIMFCLGEIQILRNVQTSAADHRVAQILSYFPANYCAFEVIQLFRMTFFMLFNVINAYSYCFINDVMKEKQYYSFRILQTQHGIKDEMTKIANLLQSRT
jgi:hypothetical protein